MLLVHMGGHRPNPYLVRQHIFQRKLDIAPALLYLGEKLIGESPRSRPLVSVEGQGSKT
jgi:hypothetical protein